MSQFHSIPAESVHSDFSSTKMDELNLRFEEEHPDTILTWAYHTFGPKAVLGTGFGPSGVFLMHRITTLGLGLPVFYLDTQLLFNETYELRDRLEKKLGISITKITPEFSVKQQAEKYGEELWNRDPDKCCHIRKVAPLQKYLADKEAWITGIRRSQSSTRKHTRILEYDAPTDVIKINPMAAWSNDDIWDYIRQNDIPYNPLHDEGYPSIGCIPCTSPVSEGEDERNGRWRGDEKIECGIHFSNGQLKRNTQD